MPRRKTSAAPTRLTDACLKKVKPPPGKRDIVLFEDRTGLGVRVQESGIISFVVQIRMPDGRRFRETLRPPYPGLSVAKARAAAQARAGEIALGLDPLEERAAAAAEREAKAEVGRLAKIKAEEDRFTLRASSCGSGTASGWPSAGSPMQSPRCGRSN